MYFFGWGFALYIRIIHKVYIVVVYTYILMVKLQMVVRRDGSSIFTCVLPHEFVVSLGWVKGRELDVSVSDGVVIIK